MAIVGLIPFVCAAIKKRRRSTRAGHYERVATGAVARGRERHALFSGGGDQSQSCRFAMRRSPADELRVSHVDSGGATRHPPPKDLSGELFSADCYERLATGGAARGRKHARFNGGGGYQSQSCRFAVRPSPAHELDASYRDGSARRRPPVDLSAQLLLPASRNDRLATSAARGREDARFNGGAHQSQSCRFAVRPSLADELGFSHDDGAALPPPENLSGKLLLPESRNERGLSKSLRFSSMRVLAWVSGA